MAQDDDAPASDYEACGFIPVAPIFVYELLQNACTQLLWKIRVVKLKRRDNYSTQEEPISMSKKHACMSRRVLVLSNRIAMMACFEKVTRLQGRRVKESTRDMPRPLVACSNFWTLGSFNVPTDEPHNTAATRLHTYCTHQPNKLVAFEPTSCNYEARQVRRHESNAQSCN